MRKVGLYTEWGICMGCNACQIACKDAHDLPRFFFGRTGP